MPTATEIFGQIQQHASQNQVDDTWYVQPDYDRPHPQGDVNFWFIRELPPSAIATTPVSQLAPGNSRGSRHCIAEEDMGNVEFFALQFPNALQGVILKINAPTRITHPEHKHHVYPVGCIVAVTFQRQYAEALKRSVD